jgi:hypothetical protein
VALQKPIIYDAQTGSIALYLMTTFSFSHGKEQTALELLTWKQIRQGTNDLFSQRQACQEAVL